MESKRGIAKANPPSGLDVLGSLKRLLGVTTPIAGRSLKTASDPLPASMNREGHDVEAMARIATRSAYPYDAYRMITLR